jgi:hypothetical protein
MLYSLSFTTHVPPPSFIHRKDESNPINQPINHLIISLISTNPSHQSINQSVNDEQQSFLHTISNKGQRQYSRDHKNKESNPSFFLRYIHTHTHIMTYTYTRPRVPCLQFYPIFISITIQHKDTQTILFYFFHISSTTFHLSSRTFYIHTHTHIPTFNFFRIQR